MTTIDHFLLLKKNTWLICDFCFWWYTLLLFWMINPKRTKKKYVKKNTRISVFGAHDLGKKKDTEKNPSLRSARETQALSRLKNIHHPLPILLQLQKKEQLIIFCVIKEKKSFMKIIPLGLVWRAFEFAKNLPERIEKTRQIVSFYFLILHSSSHWVKQTISKKKK